ncbi:MAG TPA: hypothetical protein VF473_05325 [Cyclobacteriaceae bacterium]
MKDTQDDNRFDLNPEYYFKGKAPYYCVSLLVTLLEGFRTPLYQLKILFYFI